MPSFRIHRLKDHLRANFRSAPHVAGMASVKPRDYEPGVSIESRSAYSAYFALRDAGTPLEVGDILELENGTLRICKFVGFEEAQWIVPESKPDAGEPESAPMEAAAVE